MILGVSIKNDAERDHWIWYWVVVSVWAEMEGLNNGREMATANQQRFNSNWKGLLKRWSVDQRIHHRIPSYTSVYDHPLLSDGTDHRRSPSQWRGSTQKLFRIYEPPKYYYLCDRLYEITCGFPITVRDEYSITDDDEDSTNELERKQGLLDDLDELQEYAEFTDVASVLHSEGCLFSFLRDVLSNEYAGIRAKIAEVITSMVQNYPTCQQLLIKEKVLQPLLNNFTSDPDETSRTKALGAISSLIRNNKSGITVFRREKGYAALRKALISGSVCQRDVVNLIKYLLRENNLYSQELNLASSDDAEVREAALSGLLLLARRKCKNSGPLSGLLRELPSAALPTVQSSKRMKLH